ncbi:sigma factor-like helix-turn-helix DNA-binding protein [Lysinibacillus sp. NPDC097214]|uniref:sigma factor-like helix-turn-helix DNA-binding protein n=1 Tax=Lysinibacillus sp. NPDC097214 TaxID=3390584 RepID=UPI003D07857E
MIADEQAENLIDEVFIGDDLVKNVTCPILHNALNSLTKKQKEFINLAYVEELSDTEIGLKLNKTQQAVSKTHKKALENMLTYIENQKNNGCYA